MTREDLNKKITEIRQQSQREYDLVQQMGQENSNDGCAANLLLYEIMDKRRTEIELVVTACGSNFCLACHGDSKKCLICNGAGFHD